ncbi:unnamed protein product [marine sediment metagenome]|uniref:Uncharacterized protein n=1 Tax=marine sediment metagenome TaxID=412755 RepID=X1Q0B2_9ZZZZ
MPYRIVKKGYPWQGGPDRFIKEFFPLSPYQVNLGERESGQLSELEAKRLHNLELEEDLSDSATAGAETRWKMRHPERGEVTREELQQDQKEARRRLGALEGGYFT